MISQIHSIQNTVAATVEPVTLTEAKTHLRVIGTSEDTLITALITAARQYAENYTGRVFCTSTWVWKFREFPAKAPWILEIPLAPVQSISSVGYLDGDGESQSLTVDVDFHLANNRGPDYLYLAAEKTWPTTYPIDNAVTITFVAGHGVAAAVPAPIKAAILLLIGHWYANRESVVVGTIVTEMKMAVDAILSQYRIYKF